MLQVTPLELLSQATGVSAVTGTQSTLLFTSYAKHSTARVWLCFDDAFVRLAEGVAAGLP
jgi:hypothetical protein